MTMVTCPSCKGKGGGWGIMCGPGGDRMGSLPCFLCKGAKQITEEHAARYAMGRRMYRERIARRVTVREEAARLGVGFGEWSRLEHGGVPETKEGALALATRLEEMEALAAKRRATLEGALGVLDRLYKLRCQPGAGLDCPKCDLLERVERRLNEQLEELA